MIVVRLLLCFAMVCVPIVLLVAASRRAENLIYLMFPIVGGVPAALAALLVFAPLEHRLQAHGLAHRQDVVIPLAGAVVVAIGLLVSLAVSGKLARLPARIARDPVSVIGALVATSLAGAAWGALWRLSAAAVTWMGW